jgi:hypothetical protein
MKTTTFLCFALLVASIGCSGSATTGLEGPGPAGNGGGATASRSGTEPPPSSGAEPDEPRLPPMNCNEIVQAGGLVHVDAASEPPPPPKGGAITDGTYVLTGLRFHSPDGADVPTNTSRATMVIAGRSVETVLHEAGTERREVLGLDTAGSTLSLSRTCLYDSNEPVVDEAKLRTYPYDYTATPTTIVMSAPVGSATMTIEYTKR